MISVCFARALSAYSAPSCGASLYMANSLKSPLPYSARLAGPLSAYSAALFMRSMADAQGVPAEPAVRGESSGASPTEGECAVVPLGVSFAPSAFALPYPYRAVINGIAASEVHYGLWFALWWLVTRGQAPGSGISVRECARVHCADRTTEQRNNGRCFGRLEAECADRTTGDNGQPRAEARSTGGPLSVCGQNNVRPKAGGGGVRMSVSVRTEQGGSGVLPGALSPKGQASGGYCAQACGGASPPKAAPPEPRREAALIY